MLVFTGRAALAMGDDNDRNDEPATIGFVRDQYETWRDVIAEGIAPKLTQAVQTNDPGPLLADPAWSLAWEQVNGPWNERIGKYVATTGQKEIDRLRFPLNFKMDNPYATAWARTQSAERVTQITAATQEAIRNAVGNAFESGLPPRKLAAVIRPSIGLHDRYAQAVVNKGLSMLADGATEAQAKAATERYAARLLRARSMLIARTEIVDAENAGLKASWQTSRDAGLLTAQTKRVWIKAAGDRTCDECSDFGAPGNRETTLDGLYQSTSHGTSNGPTAHPGCRCTQGLKVER